MTELILFNLFNGLIIGAFYALMALGLSLILNLTGVINFAHGGFLALGAYIAFSLIPYIGFWGALAAAPVLTALIGIVVERLLIRRLYGRDPLYSLLLTFGLAFILEDGTRYVWGAGTLPFAVPDWMMSPLSNQFFFLTGYRLFMVGLVLAAVTALFLILNRTRLGMRIRAGTLDLETVSVLGVNIRILRNLNFGLGIYLAGLAGVLAAGMLGLAADDRQLADHAELCRNHHRRPRQPARHPARRPADRRRLGAYRRVLPVGLRGGDLRDDGAGSAGPPARPARRRRSVLMRGLNRRGADLAVWLMLLTAPFWLGLIGGYTSLGTRVVVLALAAMSLNFLLGFTGVLSFGHAAYFGLGVYGAGLTIKYLVPSTLAGIAVGVIAGTVAAALIGMLIVRLRGIYFAMVTIAFGQVFYFIAYRWNVVTGGDDGLSRMATPAGRSWFRPVDILANDDVVLLFRSVLLCASHRRSWACCCTRRSAEPCWRSARTSGARASSASRSTGISGCRGSSPACSSALAGTLYALLNNFADPHDLRWDQSGDFVIMAVLGGMRAFWGPLIGAAIFVVLQDYVSSHDRQLDVVYRAVFRARRAVLPARRARPVATESPR